MKNLLMFVCVLFLATSVMAQSSDNTKTIKKTNDTQPVEFTIKKANSDSFINTELHTIKPGTKIKINDSAKKLHQDKIIDKKQKPNAIKED